MCSSRIFRTGICRFAFILFLLCVPVVLDMQKGVAQVRELEEKTVEASYEIYAADKTPNEAHDKALSRAQAEAIRKAIGTQVQAEQRSSRIESGDEVVSQFSEVVRTGASGRVVDYELLETNRIERGGRLFYRVRIRASVEPATGRPDPGFKLDMRLTDKDRTFVARETREESDEVIAEIEATEDAYLTLFSVTSDTLQVIWPNSLSRDTFVEKGKKVEFPPQDLQAQGIHLRVDIPEGRSRVRERLVAVATKQKVPFQKVPEYDLKNGSLATARSGLESLNRWLVEIPLGQRAMATVSYDVVRRPDL